MAEARTMFMAERLAAPNAAELLAKLNDLLHDDLECGRPLHHRLLRDLRCADTHAELRQCRPSAPALLRESATKCTPLDADGLLLGDREGRRIRQHEVKLEHGDIVVFYTDGITETENAAGEMFGVERLGHAVTAHRGDKPEAMVSNVLTALERFGGGKEHEDDLTLVVMKLTG
jgi:sigma-B regulation protein RsbU (phosphoserine phosphatase)